MKLNYSFKEQPEEGTKIFPGRHGSCGHNSTKSLATTASTLQYSSKAATTATSFADNQCPCAV
jgi:hypothetical protein